MLRGEYEKARRVQLDAPALLADDAQLTSTACGSLQEHCLLGLSQLLKAR